MKHLLQILFSILLVNNVFGQVLIWTEDFSTEANNSITGNNDNTANPANDWTTSCLTCDRPNEFRVEGNRFQVENTDEIATWTSEVIDITGYNNVSISVIADLIDGDLDAPDCLRFYYSLDGGANTLFTTNGTLCDFQPVLRTASQTGLVGTTLQIIITGITTNTAEDIFFDDIVVSGTLPSPPFAFQIANNQPANKVYGQPNFTSNGAGTTASLGDNSYHTTVDENTGKVFICEVGNNRILRYPNIDALTNGEAAEAVLGQPDFVSNGAGTAINRFDSPTGIHMADDGILWVSDFNNNRVLRFDNASAKVTGANADGVLGQPNFTSNGSAATQNGFANPVCVFSEDDGTLWVADLNNRRVLRYDNAAAKANGANADGVLGKADFVTNTIDLAQNRTGGISGVSVDDNGRLYVSDINNNRVLWWDNAKTLANGANADGVLCQPNYTSGGAGLSQTQVSSPRMVSITPDGRFLSVSDDDNNRILIYYNPGLGIGLVNATYVFGQPDFITGTANTGGLSASSISNPRGIYFYQTPNFETYLFVSDRGNNRTKLYVLFDLFYTTDVLTPITDVFKATEFDGDVLTFRILDSTNKGSIVLNDPNTGSFTYTPIISAIDYSDSAIYEVCDVDGCDTSIVIFNILSAIKLWARADSGVIGTPVTEWKNVAVKDDSLYTSAGLAPILASDRINFNPSLQFDGVNDAFNKQGIVNTISNVQTSVFVVSVANSQKNQFLISEDLPSGGRLAARDLYGDGNAYFDGGTVDEQNAAWGGTLGTPYLWSFIQTSSTEDIFRNGLLLSTAAGGNILGNRSTLYVGTDGSGNSYDGEIAEVMLYQHIVGDTFDLGEVDNIETYLAIKYGLTLDQTTPRDYVYDDGDTATEGVIIYHAETTHDLYDNDIAGIGFDSVLYYLNQPKSMSVNPDAVVIMEREAPWSTNSFVVWGNNDSSLTANSTNVPGGIKTRVNRVWKVDTTGTNGTVTLTFYINAFKTIYNDSTFVLLRDNDGDFLNATQYTTGITVSADGDSVTFTGIQFSDGEYFSLGVIAGYIPQAVAPWCGTVNVSDTSALVRLSAFTSLWLRADQGTSSTVDNANLTEWRDNGEFDNHVTNYSGISFPVYNNDGNNINFNPYISFNGLAGQSFVKDSLAGPLYLGNSERTWIVVTRANSLLSQSMVSLNKAGGANENTRSVQALYLQPSTNLLSIRSSCASCLSNIDRSDVVSNVNLPTILRQNNTVGDNFSQYTTYQNGSLNANSTTLGVVPGALETPRVLISGDISALNLLQNEYTGDITEVILLPTNIEGTPFVDMIETYLGLKYGVTLNHDYLSTTDTNIVYDISNGFGNGIFGIGRNNSFNFYQPRSTSETDYSGITIQSTVNIGHENYLIIGHDGAALTRIALGGQTNVLTRKWFAKMTGGVGTINLELDLATIGANPALAPADVKIGISNTSGLTNVYWISATSIVAGVATFEGIPLYDKYFTFSAAP